MDPKKVAAAILSFFHLEFVAYVRDQDDKAVNYENMAYSVWKRYTEHLTDDAQRQRLALKPIADLRQEMLNQEFDPTYPRMSPRAQAILRTKLNMPAPTAQPAPAPPTAETSSSNTPPPKS
jgi:hypothetical protein